MVWWKRPLLYSAILVGVLIVVIVGAIWWIPSSPGSREAWRLSEGERFQRLGQAIGIVLFGGLALIWFWAKYKKDHHLDG
jgi:hypothetical protein